MTDPDLAVRTADERASLIGFVEDQRLQIERLAGDLSEDEARASLVPSLTTVLGLLKHATFVEKVWFETRIEGRTRAEAGLPESVDESFTLSDADTLAGALADFRTACERSRRILAEVDLDDTVSARMGEVSVRWILLHLIREYARHAGHADILREQLRSRR
ncbi:putative damage-inducible protein DinB [Propionibacteriaceae bacterium ES.041]|uniref:DinB family protein n=1 Tax=Enemella evansiae TaxID=2016499 RepID=UPI000B965636|nr:DinB family protein [Enemella evansiae]OYN94628.1 hypothetical protein CGZ96_17275 [Enemella evansiae]PFG67692.1 putative damage-inducible protein DinB [Propionibacteriaceae bacterium ES.041]